MWASVWHALFGPEPGLPKRCPGTMPSAGMKVFRQPGVAPGRTLLARGAQKAAACSLVDLAKGPEKQTAVFRGVKLSARSIILQAL